MTGMTSDASNWDAKSWEDQLIADLRANGGRASQGPLAGNPLMVLYSTGAKSGEPRRSIVTFSEDGSGAYYIAGSYGGNPTKHPSWYYNLVANPNVTIEIGADTYAAEATDLRGAERDRAWDRHVEQLPNFGEYPAKVTGRTIPVIRIAPKAKVDAAV
jgi:deazaflavin-dependent oxidoreductase (nitroreductase family)